MGTVDKVRRRVRSCFSRGNFDPGSLRGIVMGSILPIMMSDISLYGIISRSVRDGEMPWFTADALIMSISALEAVLAPLVAWLGYRRRRTALMLWIALPSVLSLAMFAAPPTNTLSPPALCNGDPTFNPPGLSNAVITRLAMVITLGVTNALSRVAITAHGLGYLAEHSYTGMSLYVAIILMVRVYGLLVVPKFFNVDLVMWAQVLGVIGPQVINVVRLICVPEEPPAARNKGEDHGRELSSSVGRVVSNSLAMAQIFALAFLAAALWGFGYHENDIVKTKYLSVPSGTFMDSFSDILRYYLPVLVIIVCARRFSSPLMSVYNEVSAAKLAAITAALAVPLYLVLVAALGCGRGAVGGLDDRAYSQPGCSQQCLCFPPTNQFAPVCLTDQMVTYVSPCHAGCFATDSFQGISFMSNCTCGGNARATATIGACAVTACRTGWELHKLLYVVVVTVTLLAFQAQGTLTLRAVDARDHAVAAGVAGTVVAFVVFICAHALFLIIRVYTCSWFEAGACQLHGRLFPLAVGGASAALALLSALVSGVTWWRLRGRHRPEPAPDTEM